MVYVQERWFLFLFLVIFCINIVCATSVCNLGSPYVIRNIQSGLVLDASTPPIMRVQYFDGYSPQLWNFECGSAPGLYYIINQFDGKALDVIRNNNPLYVTVNERDNDSLYQQWIITSTNNVINAGTGTDLDIMNANFVPGAYVQVHKANQSAAQKFLLQKQITK